MIVLAYDHRAFEMMQKIKKYLEKKGLEYVEFANKEYTKTDSYSKFAKEANKKMLENPEYRGIYSCRTGIGISMTANRSKGIRAGLCTDVKTTFLARNDDDINVLVLPVHLPFAKVKKMINTFLNTPFEGGRHIERLKELDIE